MRRVAHRLGMADLGVPMPSAVELDEAHEELHGAPRASCIKCHQMTLFDEGEVDHG